MEKVETTIGSVKIEGPLALAPMSGITDLAFRLIVKSFGAALVYIPLVSAKALCLGNRKTFDLLISEPEERPVAAQIFGGEPETIAGAVRLLNRYPVDMVDINMGCPAPKVAGHAGGSSLMRDVKLAAEIVAAAVEVAEVPVTVKIRSGWDSGSINAPELASAVEQAGAAAVAVHPRTRSQGFAGRADWSLITRTKQCVRIPVIGSGDVCSPEDAARMLEETGCDLVMLGRAARGNPWLFARTIKLLQDGASLPGPSPGERLQTLVKHCTLSAKYDGDRRAARKMRKHAAWYIRGLKNAAITRQKVNRAQSVGEIVEICRQVEKDWHESCTNPK
ncbi:MAG: tRNA dihydrouridine synthase DusB [Candidatus Abyssubacteria bacterium]|nr:tRNA dihydrouridine synthase DusB [Candidatus Abyssubacteria bacterium]